MKRTLVAVSALLAVSALAVLPSRRTPLTNFDVRTPHAANLPDEVAPEHASAVAALRSRVPKNLGQGRGSVNEESRGAALC